MEQSKQIKPLQYGPAVLVIIFQKNIAEVANVYLSELKLKLVY